MKIKNINFPVINMKNTGINIRKLMDKYGYSVKDVQEYLGLSSVQSIYHWLNGISMPSVDHLFALSELFQIPMDSIVCGDRSIQKPEVLYSKNARCISRIMSYVLKINEKIILQVQ